MRTITVRDVRAAHKRIMPYHRETLLERSTPYSDDIGGDVYLKLENQQITNSFKVRGALNKMLQLGMAERARGVVTASAGNHAQGVGYGATQLGISAIICVPRDTAKTKLDAIRHYDVSLKIVGKQFKDAETEARLIAERTGRTYISAYNDPAVIAGQGTIALEMLKDNPAIDTIVVPVGGGGLISGIAIAAKALKPRIRILGVQTAAAPAMQRSLKAGRIIPITPKPSVAGGISIGIEQGSMTFPLVKRLVDDVLVVSEAGIRKAIQVFLDRHHKIAEGAAAAGLAALKRHRRAFKGRKVAVVVSGGNLDLSILRSVLCRQRRPPARYS